MRVVLALMIPIVLFAGVGGYIAFTESVRPHPVMRRAEIDRARWTVQLFPTDRLVPDTRYDVPAIRLLYRGTAILEQAESIGAEHPLQIELKDVSRGQNSVLVEVHFPPNSLDAPAAGPRGDSRQIQALRVQIQRNSEVVVDQTFWRDGTDPLVTGLVLFDGWATGLAGAGDHE